MIIQSYTRALKSYDRDLFAGRTMDGVACVFRRAKRFEPAGEINGRPLFVLQEGKQLIFPLTDTWTMAGRPRAWGIDRVLDRVREIDAMANERLFEEMDAANERIDESNKRHLKNEMEAFWQHERRRFAKSTDDILTHSLSKNETKRRLKDRRIKNA